MTIEKINELIEKEVSKALDKTNDLNPEILKYWELHCEVDEEGVHYSFINKVKNSDNEECYTAYITGEILDFYFTETGTENICYDFKTLGEIMEMMDIIKILEENIMSLCQCDVIE